MILQSALRFFIDALTFISLLLFLNDYDNLTAQKTDLQTSYLYLYVILPLLRSYGDISNFTLSPGKILM